MTWVHHVIGFHRIAAVAVVLLALGLLGFLGYHLRPEIRAWAWQARDGVLRLLWASWCVLARALMFTGWINAKPLWAKGYHVGVTELRHAHDVLAELPAEVERGLRDPVIAALPLPVRRRIRELVLHPVTKRCRVVVAGLDQADRALHALPGDRLEVA